MATREFFFGDPCYPDLMIKCRGVTWHLHRKEVCSKSKYIEEEEKIAPQEGRQTLIVLDSYYLETIHRVLDFVYSGDYNANSDFLLASDNQCKSLGPAEFESSADHKSSVLGLEEDEHETLSATTVCEKESEVPETEFCERLINNILVAICAQELHIEALTLKSAKKIGSESNEPLDLPEVLETVEKVYSRASRPLQRALAQICCASGSCLPATFDSIVVRSPLLGADIMQLRLDFEASLRKRAEEQCKDLESELRVEKMAKLKQRNDLRKQVKSLQQSRDDIKATRDHAARQYQRALSEPFRWQGEICRNLSCGAEFNGMYVEGPESGTRGYSWRCGYCNTRHGHNRFF